jgi:P4 family phage/plasmid primase-like protien
VTAAAHGVSARPYAEHAGDYLLAGWPGVIPVPAQAKFPPPDGYTGDAGKYTDAGTVIGWVGSKPGASVALRMPDGVIGIDVDQYEKKGKQKHGAETLAARIAEWGPLPPTWSSTARGPGQPSRIWFFRAPAQRYAGTIDPDIEIIQRHHRYAVVWPSPHHGDDGAADGTYAWYGPDGSPLPEGVIPRPEELPQLPPAWVTGLAAGASKPAGANAPPEQGQQLLLELEGSDAAEAPWCRDMAAAMDEARRALTAAEPGTRHDAMLRFTLQAVMLGAKGHPGYLTAIRALDELWNDLTAGEGRQAEFAEMVLGAARSAVTEHGAHPAGWDPCLLLNEAAYQAYAAPAPGVPEGEEPPAPIEPERFWTPYQAIGTGPFETNAELDATLARDVLARVHPALRYAPDAGTWLVRGPEAWVPRRGDAAKWAVDLVSWLMLPGDPDAADGSPEKAQAKRRARFCTNASSNGVAGKMNAQVAVGFHRSAIDLAGLDSDRDILWAGGRPYDLRACGKGPEIASWVDEGLPHLHSAAVTPQVRDTPLWDAFLAAVWPDEELRAWALRVLAIAVTGYSDKALPIMLGETDVGKTSVIDLMMSVLGTYAHTADARLLSPADRSHASIVYALKGRRLSFIDEAPRAGTMATERLKQITGGADLTGNRMAENPVTFPPTHTLILTANPEHEPNLVDAAIRRRVRLIPCDGDPAQVRAARAAIGNVNGPAWRREAPGVLAALMAEAAGWLSDPGSASNERAPEAGQRAALEIQASQDRVQAWVEDECEPWEPGTKARQLYEAFTESCKRSNVHPSQIPSETAWGRRLTGLGFDKVHRDDGNYRPLRVRPPGSFTPSPAEFMGVSGGSTRPAARLLHGSEQFGPPAPQTIQNGNSAGQTIQQPFSFSPPEGSEGLVSIPNTYAHAHTHTQENRNDRADRASVQEPPAADPPVADPPDTSQPVADRPEQKTPARKTAERKPREPKAPKPKPLRPDPALEGPVYPLPVLTARNPADPGAPPMVLPCTVAEAVAAVTPYLAELSVDVEHSGYPVSHADYELRLVQLGGEHIAAVFDPSDEAQAAAIRDLVARAGKLHAHSACADLVPLAWGGLGDRDSMWERMEDSVLIVKLGDPGLAGSDENELKQLSAAKLGSYSASRPAEEARSALFKSGRWLTNLKATTPREKSGWAMVRKDCATFERYAGSDVLDLAAVCRVLPRPDEAVLQRERWFQAICSRVAHDGFALDHPHIRAKIAEYETARDAAQRRVAELTGGAIGNPSSSKEVPAALAAMGVPLGVSKKTGNPSAAKDVLEPLARQPGYEHGELCQQILEYRHDVTTLGLLLEPLNVLCERGDSRMRPVVYTINADTGRTSCVRPNGQQFSRQGGIRACVIADDETGPYGVPMAGISADFSGVEIRVGAALSGDFALLEAELSTRCQACGHDPCDRQRCGKDQKGLHWMAARMAFGENAAKEDRYNSKRIIFSKMFGGGPETGAKQVGVPVASGRKVHRAFEQIAPGFASWDQQMRAYSEAGNRAFPAYSGRTIWLPRGRHHASGNYAIQGTARELLVDGVLRWQDTRWGHYPLLPIHDEILCFVPAAEAEEALQTLIACMRNQRFYEIYGVPIEAAGEGPFQAWPDSS